MGLPTQPDAASIYESTSSVYGASAAMLLTEQKGVVNPLQFYAATKSASELTAHAYGRVFQLLTTGLWFFMV